MEYPFIYTVHYNNQVHDIAYGFFTDLEFPSGRWNYEAFSIESCKKTALDWELREKKTEVSIIGLSKDLTTERTEYTEKTL